MSRAGWRSLLQSFRVLISGELAARVLGFLSIFVLARALEPGGFGLVTLGTTLVAYLVIFVDSGTETLNVRNIAREPQRFRDIVEPVLGLRLALSVPAAGVLGVAAVIAAEPGSDRVALGLFALILPMAALNVRWMALGVRASRAIAMSAVAKELIVLIGVLLLVRRSHDTVIVAVLIAAGELLAASVLLDAMRRRFGFIRPRIDLAAWRASLHAGRTILVNSLARATVYSFDILLIAVVLTRVDVGLYTAAYKPVLFAITGLAIFYVSFLASYSAAKGEDAAQLFRRTVAIALGATVPVALVTSITSEHLTRLAYGSDYEGAAVALAILVWCVPVLAVTGAYAQAMIAGHRERRLMKINVIGAAVNVAGNVAAVPLVGIAGAAAVTLASEVLILTLMARAVVGYGIERSPWDLAKDFVRFHKPARSGRARS
jgi:O-antigen/teichoic acid export membrane protein